MGVTHLTYPRTTDELAALRAELLDPLRTGWIQVGGPEWFRLSQIGVIHRVTKLGMSFEACRPLENDVDGPLELFHVCRTQPCTFVGGPKSSNKKGLPVFHVSSFAFSDGTTEAPQPAGVPMVPPVGRVAKVSWQVAVAVLIVVVGLLTRLKEVLNDMSVQVAVTSTFKAFFGFFFDKLFVILFGAETGVMVGFCESLWEDRPEWFVWLVRACIYGTIGFKLHLHKKVWTYVLGKVASGGGGTGPGKAQQPIRPPRPEPASEAEESSCAGGLILFNIDGKAKSMCPAGCSAEATQNTKIAYQGWVISHLTESDRQVGVPLCDAHQAEYQRWRGSQICARKECYSLGSLGPEGLSYCPKHVSAAVTPPPPAQTVKFEDLEEKPSRAEGLEGFTDDLLMALIENLDPHSEMSTSRLVESLTRRYGGNLLDNAFRVRDPLAADRKEKEGGLDPRLTNLPPRREQVPAGPEACPPAPQILTGRVISRKPKPTAPAPTPPGVSPLVSTTSPQVRRPLRPT